MAAPDVERHVYAAFRILVGALFPFHGLQKLFGLHGGDVVPVWSMYWFAGVIELAGGILVGVGLLTRVVALVAAAQMAAAYVIAHLPRSIWPIENGGEPAALFFLAFAYIAARGPGHLSVDAGLRGAASRPGSRVRARAA